MAQSIMDRLINKPNWQMVQVLKFTIMEKDLIKELLKMVNHVTQKKRMILIFKDIIMLDKDIDMEFAIEIFNFQLVLNMQKMEQIMREYFIMKKI